ncbi:MAG: glycosyltransferase family 39 protein [Candidatus Omnitrophica bacterium]|nr:glycosyltransferase family 39 protein [Candidatus Omnitrophota bacterium]
MMNWAWLSGRTFQMCLIAFGVLLRARHYFENRSFWQDEICLALSIVNRSFQEIWQHILLFPDFAQAPLIFQLIEKVFVGFFGNSEMSLRFFPFIASIAALLLARRFFSRLLTPPAATIALAIFALIEPLVYFAAELKPYGIDVLAALIVYEVFINVRKTWEPKRIVVLAITGAVMIWFSYAMLFILAGCGIFLLYEEALRRDMRRVSALLLCYALWILSFVLLYQISLSKMLGGSLVGNWRLAGGFAPHTFFSGEGVLWLGQAFLNMFRSPLGMDWPWIMTGFFFYGSYTLIRRDKIMAGFLLGPLILVMAAAALDKYPFFERLVLFLVPGLLAVFAIGVWSLSTKVKRYGIWPGVLIFGVVLFSPVQTAFNKALSPRGQEENREAVQYISSRFQSGDEIIISNQAQYPFWYYGQKFGLMKKLQLQPVPGGGTAAWTPQLYPDVIHDHGMALIAIRRGLGVYDDEGYYRKQVLVRGMSDPVFIPSTAPEFLKGKGRVWVFLSHHNSPEYPSIIDQTFSRAGIKIDSFERPGVAVYLYKL